MLIAHPVKVKKNLKSFAQILINDEFLICSTVTGDFNDLGTNWCKDDITNSTGQEINSFTSSARYKQIIDKLTHFINKSMPCIDLIFCLNQIIISQYVFMLPSLTNATKISSMATLTSVYPTGQNMSVKYGITIWELIVEKLLNPIL